VTSLASDSRALATTPEASVYEPPAVLATFPKDELVAELPEDIEAHMHAVESS
jgi:hypothetical protein